MSSFARAYEAKNIILKSRYAATGQHCNISQQKRVAASRLPQRLSTRGYMEMTSYVKNVPCVRMTKDGQATLKPRKRKPKPQHFTMPQHFRCLDDA